MNVLTGIFLTVTILISPLAFSSTENKSSAFDNHIRLSKSEETSSTKIQLPRTLVPGVFQQDIDHFGQAPGQKFAQRYWVESSYASQSPDAPILLHICGEADATDGYFLKDNAIEWAKALGAHIVYLEHRYYGQSLPFSDLSTDHLQFLTLGNVIEDLATFQKWIAASQGWKGQWISLGGSYSGTLSALYRQKHPELVIGALAASAPMISGIGQAVGTQKDVDDLSPISPSGNTGDRQWTYQACTTFGFWQAEGESRGSALDLPSDWLCRELFGNTPQVNPQVYNQNYNLPFISGAAGAPTQIFFSYGDEDVWTDIGLSQETNSNTNIEVYLIKGAGHHFDLNPPSQTDKSPVKQARAMFTALARQWLKQSF